jgi:Fe-S-cluster-containing hydrogenase component 2
MKVDGIERKKCVGVCPDGARALTGKHTAVVAQIKAVVPDAKCVHRSVHRAALAARKTPAILKTVLTEAVKVVNLIKSRATSSRFFRFYVTK